MRLLTPAASSPKLRYLERELGLHAAIQYLLPDERTCPWAHAQRCFEPCLVFSGKAAVYPLILRAREERRELLFDSPAVYWARLRLEIAAHERRALAEGLRPAIRLDGTSDLGLAFKVAAEFPGVQFWDYTKGITRVRRAARGGLPNVHLTFSRGADNEAECEEALERGVNVAVPFHRRKGDLPTEWRGREVLNGDEHDYRFLDPLHGVYVGLSAKGARGKADTSGFVVEV